MNIAIVGLGYVGAVSAASLADAGHNIWGVLVAGAKQVGRIDLPGWLARSGHGDET